jgi:hypothetical protein
MYSLRVLHQTRTLDCVTDLAHLDVFSHDEWARAVPNGFVDIYTCWALTHLHYVFIQRIPSTSSLLSLNSSPIELSCPALPYRRH